MEYIILLLSSNLLWIGFVENIYFSKYLICLFYDSFLYNNYYFWLVESYRNFKYIFLIFVLSFMRWTNCTQLIFSVKHRTHLFYNDVCLFQLIFFLVWGQSKNCMTQIFREKKTHTMCMCNVCCIGKTYIVYIDTVFIIPLNLLKMVDCLIAVYL